MYLFNYFCFFENVDTSCITADCHAMPIKPFVPQAIDIFIVFQPSG